MCFVQAPADEAKPLFLQYAGLEEEHGLARSAMEVYDRAVKTVPLKERLTVYELYLARAHEYFGLGKVALATLLPLQAACCLESWPGDTAHISCFKCTASSQLACRSLNDMSRAESACLSLPACTYKSWGAKLQPLCQVREIYETAIEEQEDGGLSDEDCKKMCLRYAALERRLGEIDRARAIYVHASSLADPRTDPGFWADWNGFEVKHGNEDTFRWAAMRTLFQAAGDALHTTERSV